jgi:hypothetical protein
VYEITTDEQSKPQIVAGLTGKDQGWHHSSACHHAEEQGLLPST